MMRLTGISRALLLGSLLLAVAPLPAQQLRMSLQGDHLRIENGQSGARVGLLLGFERADYQLPGPAHVQLGTLAILDLGVLDANGAKDVQFAYEGDPIEPLLFLAQAISVDSNGQFATSKLFQMHFDGLRHIHSEMIALLQLDGSPGARALRPRRLVA